MRLLTIDPGLRCLGAALFEDGRLIDARLVKSPSKETRDADAWLAMADEVYTAFCNVDDLLIEMMVVRATRREVRPDDLLQLVGIAGVLIGMFRKGRVIRPEEWKGRLVKRIHHQRIITELTRDEFDILNRIGDVENYYKKCRACRGNSYPSDALHNVIDAVGIGLYDLNR